MVKIIFTKHAKLRCKQQNINMEILTNELTKIPPGHGKITWKTNNMTRVGLDFKQSNIALVTTVITKQKYMSTIKNKTAKYNKA
ncbi:hypothetical protein EBB07_28425 [Paenibacillaceae bacterium]|nr:hypothetical protein EBB07_28425 [Paenibacillaceae bacterium]